MDARSLGGAAPIRGAAAVRAESEDVLRPGRGDGEGGGRGELRPLSGGDARHRGGERLRQERHRAVDPGDRRSAGPDRRAARSSSAGRPPTAGREPRWWTWRSSRRTAPRCGRSAGRRSRSSSRSRCPRSAPSTRSGNQIIEAIMLHQRVDRRPGAREDDRDAAAGRRVLARAARRPALQPAERGPAPAGHDRDGAVLPSRPC